MNQGTKLFDFVRIFDNKERCQNSINRLGNAGKLVTTLEDECQVFMEEDVN